MGLVAFAVAVRSEVVLARHDIDTHAAAGQVVQRGRSGGEVCRPPIAGADRDERLEGGGPRGERGRDGEGVGPAPAGADQRALPAVLLQRLRVAGQRLQAVVVFDSGIAAVAGFHVVGDIPKKLGCAAHAMGLQFCVVG